MGPGVITDYNSKLLSEGLPLLSHDWPHLSVFFSFLSFFRSAAHLLAFLLMSTICSHSNSDRAPLMISFSCM